MWLSRHTRPGKAHPPKAVWTEWPIFLLQDQLHCLHRHHPEEFRRRFLGSQDDSVLSRYWGALRSDDPRLAHHPVTCQADWRKRAIPGRLHGDGVPYGKGKLANMCVNNVSSVLSDGDSLDCLNLWWWLPKAIACTKAVHGWDTFGILWKVAIWDLLCCLHGEFLQYDWEGREIGPGHARYGKTGRIMADLILAILQATNDTEHNANFLNLQHWQSLRPCNWCPASAAKDTLMPYSDFEADSDWIPLCVTVEDWVADPTDHPLWQAWALIGITIFSLCLDILHILDLGVLQYFLGSTIWTLVHESGLPGSFHQRAAHVWELICHAHAVLGTNYRERLTREDFYAVFGSQVGPTPGSFPELSGKAARTRHALPAVLKAVEQVHAAQHLHFAEHVLRLEALRMLVEFYAIVMAGGHVLAEPAAERVITVVDAFLRKQNKMAMIYWERKVKHYNVTFKSHLFWHMARQARYFNPRHGWTYRDESFVGSVAKVVKCMCAATSASHGAACGGMQYSPAKALPEKAQLAKAYQLPPVAKVVKSVISGNGQTKSGRALAVKWRRLQWFRHRRRQGVVFADPAS